MVFQSPTESRRRRKFHLRHKIGEHLSNGEPILFKETVRRAARIWETTQVEVASMLGELEAEGRIRIDEDRNQILSGEAP